MALDQETIKGYKAAGLDTEYEKQSFNVDQLAGKDPSFYSNPVYISWVKAARESFNQVDGDSSKYSDRQMAKWAVKLASGESNNALGWLSEKYLTSKAAPGTGAEKTAREYLVAVFGHSDSTAYSKKLMAGYQLVNPTNWIGGVFAKGALAAKGIFVGEEAALHAPQIASAFAKATTVTEWAGATKLGRVFTSKAGGLAVRSLEAGMARAAGEEIVEQHIASETRNVNGVEIQRQTGFDAGKFAKRTAIDGAFNAAFALGFHYGPGWISKGGGKAGSLVSDAYGAIRTKVSHGFEHFKLRTGFSVGSLPGEQPGIVYGSMLGGLQQKFDNIASRRAEKKIAKLSEGKIREEALNLAIQSGRGASEAQYQMDHAKQRLEALLRYPDVVTRDAIKLEARKIRSEEGRRADPQRMLEDEFYALQNLIGKAETAKTAATRTPKSASGTLSSYWQSHKPSFGIKYVQKNADGKWVHLDKKEAAQAWAAIPGLKAPERTWVHRAFDIAPSGWVGSLFDMRPTRPDSARWWGRQWLRRVQLMEQMPSRWIPHDISMGRYTRRIVEAVDHAAVQVGLIDGIEKDLSKLTKAERDKAFKGSITTVQEKLKAIASKLDPDSSSRSIKDPQEAIYQAQRELEQFVDQNRGALRSYASKLKEITDAIHAYANTDVQFSGSTNAQIVGVGLYGEKNHLKGHIGLTEKDVKGSSAWLNDLQDELHKLCNGDFDYLNIRRKEGEIDSEYAKRVAHFIQEDFRKIAEIGTHGGLRLRNEQIMKDVTETLDWLHPTTFLNPMNWARFTRGVFAPRDTIQYIRSRERAIQEGYYNPYKRKSKVVDGDKIADSKNVERAAFQIESIGKTVKNRNKGVLTYTESDIGAVMGKVDVIYNYGWDSEALTAFRHLKYKTGKGGPNHLDESFLKGNSGLDKQVENAEREVDNHKKFLLDHLRQITTEPLESNKRMSQRDIVKTYTDTSQWFRWMRRFPWQSEVSTPWKEEFITGNITHGTKWTAAKLTGGRIIAPPDSEWGQSENSAWKYKFLRDVGEKPTWRKNFTENVLKRAVIVPFNWVTLPVQAGGHATMFLWNTAKPLTRELAYAGGILAATGLASQAVIGHGNALTQTAVNGAIAYGRGMTYPIDLAMQVANKPFSDKNPLTYYNAQINVANYLGDRLEESDGPQKVLKIVPYTYAKGIDYGKGFKPSTVLDKASDALHHVNNQWIFGPHGSGSGGSGGGSTPPKGGTPPGQPTPPSAPQKIKKHLSGSDVAALKLPSIPGLPALTNDFSMTATGSSRKRDGKQVMFEGNKLTITASAAGKPGMAYLQLNEPPQPSSG